MIPFTLENLSEEGILIVDAGKYEYGTALASDTQIVLRNDSEKKIKKIVYQHATTDVKNRLFDFFGRDNRYELHNPLEDKENLVMEVRE